MDLAFDGSQEFASKTGATDQKSAKASAQPQDTRASEFSYIDEYGSHLSPSERFSEEERMKEARRESQLQIKLQDLKKKQIVLQMFTDQVKSSFTTKSYNRKTNLDKPCDEDKPMIEEYKDSREASLSIMNQTDSKLTKEELIDDKEIKSQFIACNAYDEDFQTLEMQIDDDITRLNKMYLENSTNLKIPLPSDNVEYKMYLKNYSNTQQTQVTESSRASKVQTPKIDRASIRATELKNSFADRTKCDHADTLARSLRGGSISGAISVYGTSSRDGSIASSRQSTMDPKKPSAAANEDVFLIQPCTPILNRIDQVQSLNQQENAALWQEFFQELRNNPVVMTDLVAKVMAEGSSQMSLYDGDNKVFDIAHSTFLVHLSQFFFDSIHSQERNCFAPTSNFLRFFMTFAQQCISPTQFYRDSLNNQRIRDDELKSTIQCLFEGLTRTLPAFNFLRFVFQGQFAKVNLFAIENDLKKLKDKNDRATNVKQPRVDRPQTPNVQNQPAQSGGLLNWIKRKLRSSSPTGQPIQNDLAKIRKQQEAMWNSLAMIYGGQADPFEGTPIPDAPTDTKQLYRRYDEIEASILSNSCNNGKFLQDEFNFQALPEQKIPMTEKKVKEELTKKLNTKDGSSSEQPAKTVKDLTHYIKFIVQKNFEQMLNFSQKIPFAIKAMLKILVIRSRGSDDFISKIKPDRDEIHLLCEILIAGWLNAGYRNPKCFGIQPTVEKELELEFIYFQASRIIFEHLMLMMKLPENDTVIGVKGFDIKELNKFIEEMSHQVFIFWTRFINVDISEIMKEPQQPEIIDSNVLRVDDLDLMYVYASKLAEEVQQKANPQEKPDQRKFQSQHYQYFLDIMGRLKASVGEPTNSDVLDESKLFIPRNSTSLTIQGHFAEMLGRQDQDPTTWWPFEFYLQFLNRKTDDQTARELQEWNQQCLNFIKLENKEFVIKELAISMMQADKDATPPISKETRLERLNSFSNTPDTSDKQVTTLSMQRHIARSTQQYQASNHLSGTRLPLDTRQVRIHKFQNSKHSVSQVETMLFNLFNSLRVLVDSPELLIEPLRDMTSDEESKDLVQLLHAADQLNKSKAKPSTKVSVGCMHITKMLRALNLEGNFEIQNKIMQHFVQLIEKKIKSSKEFLDEIVVRTDILAVDVERFESNITSMKQFHSKYDNSLKFMKTISRYNPEVCFLECYNYDLTTEWRSFKGLLLNMSCSIHQTSLPICAYMLFGGLTRRGDLGSQGPEETPNENMLAIEQPIREVRDRRIQRFREHHYAHTTFTVSLQHSHSGLQPQDEQIRLIEDMIEYYTDRKVGQHYLKVLVRAEHEKYKYILNRDVVEVDLDVFTTDAQRFDQIRRNEPLDYMNIVKTYTMFLQHISVFSSVSTNESYIDEHADHNPHIKQHYDFLMCDLPAKALRYQIHDYIMKRIHKTIFNTGKTIEMDHLVQKLILDKQNDPAWLLTSEDSRRKVHRGIDPQDFTKTHEWCDPFIYSASLKTLLKIADEPTPHQKSIYIEEAVKQAVNAMRIATPYKKLDEIQGAAELERVQKHLLLEVCKIYDKAKTNPRLYSQLLYILLFNVPQNEQVMYALIKQQIQEQSRRAGHTTQDFSKLPLSVQHQQYLGRVNSRYKVFDWFSIIQGLLNEHFDKLLKKGPQTRN